MNSESLNYNPDQAETEPSVEEMLSVINAADIAINTERYYPPKNTKESIGVTFSLPYDCSLVATYSEHDDGSKSMYIDNFYVNPKLKSSGASTGYGIGTRLLKELLHFAQEEGVESIAGDVKSKTALIVRAKVFGKDNLTFKHWLSGTIASVTYDEIIKREDESINFLVFSKVPPLSENKTATE